MHTDLIAGKHDIRIGVIGLGYVGWPLALAFSAHVPTRGFDIDVARIDALKRGEDATGETGELPVGHARPELSADIGALADCNVFIVTVPTPMDEAKRPDLEPLRRPAARSARCSSRAAW